MRALDLSTRRNGDVTVVAVVGSVDAVTTPRLAEALEAELEVGNHDLVVDLSDVDYMSSAGLRAVLATVKRARAAGGDLRLAAVQPAVFKVFELSGFTSIVRFFDHADDAATSYA
jgi:anti-sigma B factor antagonist